MEYQQAAAEVPNWAAIGGKNLPIVEVDQVEAAIPAEFCLLEIKPLACNSDGGANPIA
jgi:hypothetical protein